MTEYRRTWHPGATYDKIAKFWLEPVRLQSSGGFARVEIARIERLVTDHRFELVEAWNEYFGH